MKPKEARKLTVTLIIVGFAVMLMGYFHLAFFCFGSLRFLFRPHSQLPFLQMPALR